MTFAAITTLPKTTHNTSTLNTGETSSNYSVKLSLSPHKSSRNFSPLTDSRFIQDPGCKLAVEKETQPPSAQVFTTSLWPGQKSASILLLPNSFDS